MTSSIDKTTAIETSDIQDELYVDELPELDATDLELEQRLNFERSGTTSISYC